MPTGPRPSWLAALVGLALLAAPAGAALAAEAPGPAQVEIAAVGPDGLGGLALVAPAEGGTSVQLLVVGAPAGTTAVVHAGSCGAIDPAPVGLLGDVADGQLQAALPLPPEVLGDGGHVIVLHPGLDLATALGCGAIPALAAAPAPSAPAAAGGTYTGPHFGFSVTWDGTWTQGPLESLEAADRVILTSSPAVLIIGAARSAEGDAAACLRKWEQDMLDLAVAGRLSEFTKLAVDEAAPPVGPMAAYGFSVTGEDGSTRERVAHYECRPLGDGAVIEFITETDAADYADALARRAPVVASLVLSAAPPAAPSTPTQPAGAFRDPDGVFSIAWPAPWQQVPVEGVALFLADGTSGLSFNVLSGSDTEECLLIWRAANIDAMQQAGQIIDPRVHEDERRRLGEGPDDPPAAISASYVYRDAVLDGQPSMVSWAGCLAVPGGALAIYQTAHEDVYATESQARDALLASLSIPAADEVAAPPPAPGPDGPAPAQSAPPASEPVPVPAASAAAAMDPGCAGVPEWGASTIARFDRLEGLRIEAREVGGYEFVGFVAAFGGQVAGMAARQEAGPVPTLAAEANAQAIDAFGILEESADLQYQGLTDGGGAGRSGSLGEGQRLFEAGMQTVNDVRKEVERLVAICTPEG